MRRSPSLLLVEQRQRHPVAARARRACIAAWTDGAELDRAERAELRDGDEL